jgi:hypothetical protein
MEAGQRNSGAAGQCRHTGGLLATEPSARRPRGPAAPPSCNRCNFPVSSRALGCKNPCPNCGTIYPLGDCSD